MIIKNTKNKTDTNIQVLEKGNKKIKYVRHLADIHIHKSIDRKTEYEGVFKNLEKTFNDETINSSNSVIVVCGDIVHDKLELSDISNELLGDFFTKLCKEATTIVILGNHDVSRMIDDRNALFGFFNFMEKKHNNLFLLTESGLYEYHNIIFGHTRFSENVVQPCNIDTDKIKIALYHGTIHNSINENGYKNQNDKKMEKTYLCVNDFKDYDFVMLGDIHKRQFFGKEKNIAYSGSLIQQDITESLDKGYILWNLKNGKGEFRAVNNDYGKLKIKIDNEGKYDIDFNKIPKNLDVQVTCQSLKQEDIDKFYITLEKKGINIVEKNDYMDTNIIKLNTKLKINGKNMNISLVKSEKGMENIIMSKIEEDSNKIKTNLNIEDINTNLILKLLRDFLKDETIVNEIKKNKKNGSSKQIELVSLIINNMAVYGENVTIPFEKMNGIIGLLGKNSDGKSNLIDCLTESIFDIPIRGTRRDMINNNAKSFKSEIILIVNGITYKITRHLTRKGDIDATPKVIIYEKKGDKYISLSTSAKVTNKIIKDKIGTIDDFITNCIVPQKSIYNGMLSGFGELKAEDKAKILFDLSGLNVFLKLEEKCKTELSKVTRDINEINDNLRDIYIENKTETEILNEFKTIEKLESELKGLRDVKDKKNGELIEINNAIIVNNTTIKNIQDWMDNNDMNGIDDLVDNFNDDIKKLTDDVKKNNDKIKDYDNEIKKMKYIDKNSTIIKVKKQIIEFENKTSELKKENGKIENIKNDLDKYTKECNDIKDHKYDPKCEFCMKNTITKTKLYLDEKINECNNKNKKIKRNIQDLVEYIDENKDENIEFIRYIDIMEKKEKLKEIQNEKKQNISDIQKKLNNIGNMNKKNNNNSKLEQINDANDNIKKYNGEINKLTIEINTIEGKITELCNKVNKLKNNKEKYEPLNEKLKKNKNKKNNLNIIIHVLEQNGILDCMMKKATEEFMIASNELFVKFGLPKIRMIYENCRNIKNKKGELTIPKGKLHIIRENTGISIVKDGGYHKQITNMIFRLVFSRYKNNINTNFMIIDEVFDSCDDESKEYVIKFIKHIKNIFKWVLIISHKSDVKNLYDKKMYIKSNNNGSKKIVMDW
ncbi:MAG: hypothetical protein FJY19_07365 [Bacteroidetes bacterium]|nr:hypothetical protein [Bacteroidota bacterium]